MKKSLILVICALVALTSCKKIQNGLNVSPAEHSTGKASEILLVMDKSQWDTIYQNQVKEIIGQPQPGLNQVEPMFDVYHINPDLFKDEFTKRANIIYMELDPQSDSTTYTLEENYWIRPQTYVHIKGSDPQACVTLFQEHQQEILQKFRVTDLAKLQLIQAQNPNIALQNKVKEKFGVLLTIPKEYEIARECPDFLWIAYRTPQNDRSIIIYKSKDTDMSPAGLIRKRNIATQYIEGNTKDIYPVVVEFEGLPIVSRLNIWQKEGMQMRGLWETEADYMGGPFLYQRRGRVHFH